jgi:hypothetical protein
MGRNDMLLPVESTMGVGLNSADQLMLSSLLKLEEVMTEKLPFYPEVKISYSVDPMFNILSAAQKYSVTTIQVAAHAVYSLCLLVASTRPPPQSPAPRSSFSSLARSSFSILSSTVATTVAGAVGGSVKASSKPGSKANSFSEPQSPLSHVAGGAAGAAGCASVAPVEYALRHKLDHNQSLLDYCAVRVREAGKVAAMRLLVRMEGTMSEMMLNIIKEEIARSEGQKWRRCVERVS